MKTFLFVKSGLTEIHIHITFTWKANAEVSGKAKYRYLNN